MKQLPKALKRATVTRLYLNSKEIFEVLLAHVSPLESEVSDVMSFVSKVEQMPAIAGVHNANRSENCLGSRWKRKAGYKLNEFFFFWLTSSRELTHLQIYLFRF